VTKELNGLINKTTKAAKKMKESAWLTTTLVSVTVKDSSAILLLLEVRIRSVMLMMIIVLALRRRLRPTLRVFFMYVDLKKKRVGYPSVMNFEGQSGSQEICAVCEFYGADICERTMGAIGSRA
jgi:hypothetical protein